MAVYVTNKFLKAFSSLKKDRGSKPGSTPYIIKDIIRQLEKGEGAITNEYQNHRSTTNRNVYDIHPGGKGDRNNTVMIYRYNNGNLELLDIVTKHDALDRKIKGGDKYSVTDKEFDMSMLEALDDDSDTVQPLRVKRVNIDSMPDENSFID